jgi:hypothetical protein
MKKVLIALWLIKSTFIFAQTDTLSNSYLRYITPYESVIYPGMKGKGYTVSTYFRFLPEEKIQLEKVQKNGFVFELDSMVLNKGKWHIVLIKEYFDAKHRSSGQELEVLQYGHYPLIKVKNPYPSKQPCDKCFSIMFSDTLQSSFQPLHFENILRYSTHAP